MRRMCKLKDVSAMTNGLLSPYKARLLFLQGELAGVRLGGENSPILIDLDYLDNWLEKQSLSNLKQFPSGDLRIRRID
jgi:hypothetical protein